MKIDIYYSPAQRKIECLSVDTIEGMQLGEVLPASLAEAVLLQGFTCAVWGRAVGLDYKLQAGDRV